MDYGETFWGKALEAYYPKIVDSIYFLTRDREFAKDIAQDTFVRAIEKFHQLRDPEKFSSWLFIIAFNLTKTRSKKEPKTVPLTDVEFVTPILYENFPLELAEKREVREAVLNAINQLPIQEQRVIVLRYYCDFKEHQIADILNISVGAVKSYLFRARAKLRRSLSKWFEDNNP